MFGTNDKPALVTGIVVDVDRARRRARLSPLAAGGRRPARLRRVRLPRRWAMATDPQGSTVDGVVSAVLAVVAGIGAFTLLWQRGFRRARQPSASRRR